MRMYRVLVGSFVLLFVACFVEASVTNDYFEAHVSAATFEGDAHGRAYASVGNRLFAMGGRSAEGGLLREVQVLEPDGEGFALSRGTLSEGGGFVGVYSLGMFTRRAAVPSLLRFTTRMARSIVTHHCSVRTKVRYTGRSSVW
jgi:hypothetical protein